MGAGEQAKSFFALPHHLHRFKNRSRSLRHGEVFGFLGPNGAGKTTTINMLCTLLKPTSGKATVHGFDILAQKNEVRESIGLVFQDPSLDDKLTGRENLEFHMVVYRVPRDVREKRASEVLDIRDVDPVGPGVRIP